MFQRARLPDYMADRPPAYEFKNPKLQKIYTVFVLLFVLSILYYVFVYRGNYIVRHRRERFSEGVNALANANVNTLANANVNTLANATHSQNNVPKIIWTYWSTPELPEEIKLCIASWRKYNPNYTIHILNRETYAQYVDIPPEIVNNKNFNDCPQHFSDLVRICLLAQHGGVWMDGSILLSSSLDSVIPQDFPFEFFGYHHRHVAFTTPIIENWFIACPPGSRFIQLWRDEFLKAGEYNSMLAYGLSTMARYGLSPNIPHPDIGYFAMHISAQKLLQYDKYPIDRLVLRDADENGFRYTRTAFSKLWPEESIAHACKNPAIRYPMMKFSKNSRKIFSKFSNEQCGWV